MPRVRMDALFIIVRRTLPLATLALLSACITNNVDVDCQPGEPKPGISCSAANNVIQLPQHTLVSSIANVVTIPPGQSIPPNAECYYNVDTTKNSTKCKNGIPGQPCGFTGGKCRDTYTISTTKCACQCNP